MKFTKFALFAACASFAAAKGLYEIEETATPVDYTLNLGAGFDSNTSPITSNAIGEQESFFASASVGASTQYSKPHYSLATSLNVGILQYFTENIIENDRNINGTGRLNFTYNFDELNRFTSQNFVFTGLEPDQTNDVARDRRDGEYTSYSTRNLFGHRWSERVGTEHGFAFQGANYDSGAEFSKFTLVNDVRYSYDDKTRFTAGHNYIENNNDTTAHRFTVGINRKLSSKTGATLDLGYSSLENAAGSTSASPYANFSLKHQLSEKSVINAFASYLQDDTFAGRRTDFDSTTGFTSAQFEVRTTLRFGISTSYQLSEKLSLFGGANFVNTVLEDETTSVTSDGELVLDLFTISAGARYALTENVALSLSGLITESSADEATTYDYTRNLYNLGVVASF